MVQNGDRSLSGLRETDDSISDENVIFLNIWIMAMVGGAFVGGATFFVSNYVGPQTVVARVKNGCRSLRGLRDIEV